MHSRYKPRYIACLFNSAAVKFTTSEELDCVSSGTEFAAEPNMHGYSSTLNTEILPLQLSCI